MTYSELLEEPLLTPEEVCELLRVTKRWVYDNARSGVLPVLRVGRQLRFRRGDLEKWLADNGVFVEDLSA